MPELRYSVVDAFTLEKPGTSGSGATGSLSSVGKWGAFTGNPASVFIFEKGYEIGTETLYLIAREQNHSESAFIWPEGEDGHFLIRWITPTDEVELCGHATLASSWAILQRWPHLQQIFFRTLHVGQLIVKRHGPDMLEMDFPLDTGISAISKEDAERVVAAYHHACPALKNARFVGFRRNTLAIAFMAEVELPAGQRLADLKVNAGAVKHLEGELTLLTTRAPAHAAWDIETRVFSPQTGIDEDPVTGVVHTALANYWRTQPGFETKGTEQNPLEAYQASARGGRLTLVIEGDRVMLRGRAVTVSEGIMRF